MEKPNDGINCGWYRISLEFEYNGLFFTSGYKISHDSALAKNYVFLSEKNG